MKRTTKVSRKRAPGGGRKPKGDYRGNTAVLSIRITPELRSALSQSAKRNGRSVSQEVQSLLKTGLDNRAGHKKHLNLATDQVHLTAVTDFLALAIESIESETGEHWQDDRFTFEAVRAGINLLLDMLTPDGEIVTPDLVKSILAASDPNRLNDPKFRDAARSPEEMRAHDEWRATPEGVGFPAVRGLWIALRINPDDLAQLARASLGVKAWKNRNKGMSPYRREDPPAS